MVCLGNICRSPLAEGILKSKLAEDQFMVNSAGTEAYHTGKPPDPRSIDIAAKNGIDISHQSARKFVADDFRKFDKILVMDRSNLSNLKQMALTEQDKSKISLLIENNEVPDPYYGNPDDFKKVFDLIDQACQQLADQLQSTKR